MISSSFRLALSALCVLLVYPAHAQKTKAQLNTEIGTNFPDNNSGVITPQNLRTVTGDIVNSIMPTAPVTTGNLACFNGITGLLKDCGSILPSGTGVPISSILGLGTGVGTWLATPSSAKLAATLTDETGTGAAVFANGSTINPRALNTVRYASQFGLADWCANVVAAIADIGAQPGIIVVDNNQTINACSGAGNILLGNDHVLSFVSGGIYMLNRTIQFGNYGSAIIGIGGGNGGAPPITTGSVVKWTGGVGSPMFYLFGSSFSYIARMGLDCNNTSGCIGIHMNGNNAPITTRNVFENFEISGAHVGIVIGSASTSAVSGAACASNVNQDGCSENDVFTIRGFQLFGNCGDTTAEGIRINSLNAAQLSSIGPANIQCANIGVNVINMNDNFTLTGLTLGSVIGTNPTLINIGSGVVNGPDIISCESEAGTYSVVDNAAGGTQNWSGNQFNQPAITQGNAITVSTSNIYNALQVGGATAFTSIGDVFSSGPTFAGSGILYNKQQTWTPTMACAAGSGTWTGQTGKYTRYPGYTAYSVTATLSALGTCSGSVQFSLPFTTGVSSGAGYGRESAINGKTLAVSSNTTIISVFNYDNTFNGGNGAVYMVSGTFPSP
ncbi:hypothetical protein [Bradyrhizobium sp. LA7.1]|uniref:hypothetical protein n=1 Tax=Bradyrhizobium sp. LA7.1 TaxID=3156324 RepID=UPI0033979690